MYERVAPSLSGQPIRPFMSYAIPKSISWAVPSSPIRTFAGFRSLWTIRSAWAARNPSTTWRTMVSTASTYARPRRAANGPAGRPGRPGTGSAVGTSAGTATADRRVWRHSLIAVVSDFPSSVTRFSDRSRATTWARVSVPRNGMQTAWSCSPGWNE